MNIQKLIKEYKIEMEEYENEIRKLEKQKIEYLEVDKKPPKRIEKRIKECNIIINYYKNLIDKIIEAKNDRLRIGRVII